MSLNDSIPPVITQFHCTGLGLKHISTLESETDPVENDLLSDEVEVLRLINDYHQNTAEETSLNIEQKHTVAVKFAEFYEKVNLTRLVVLGLLKYKPTAMQLTEKTPSRTTEREVAKQSNQSQPHAFKKLNLELPALSDDAEMEIDLLDEADRWSSVQNQTREKIEGMSASDIQTSTERNHVATIQTSPENIDEVDPMLKLAAGLE